MLSILAERIHDGRLLRLIRHMLRAGYLKDWRWNATLSRAPRKTFVICRPCHENIHVGRTAASVRK